MNEIDAKALFVREGDRIGIITKTDLADAAILRRLPIEAPVASVAQYKVVSVGADEFVSMALLQMTKHNKRRVAVTEGGAYIGILEDVALLSFLAGNSQLVADRIDRAERSRISRPPHPRSTNRRGCCGVRASRSKWSAKSSPTSTVISSPNCFVSSRPRASPKRAA